MPVFLALGLTLALAVGVYWEKLAQAWRDFWQAKGRLKNARREMWRSRLRFLLVGALVFAVAWPYLHGFR